MGEKRKLAIIVWSGTVDKLYPAAILSNVAASSGWEVGLFFTFWGLQAITKENLGRTRVTSDYAEYAPAMEQAIKAAGIPPWHELLVSAKATGNVKVFACSTTMQMFGIKDKSQLADFVDDVVGAATFLEWAKDANITLFI